MKKNLTRFMAMCLGRPQEQFTNQEIVFFYTAFIIIMTILSVFDVGMRM
jgi:hypothetical protein